MKRYVVGFLFDDALATVCLIAKNRPGWMKGLLNGVGGEIDRPETAAEAMCREFEEEAGVQTPESLWVHVATLYFPYKRVEYFAARDSGAFDLAEACTDEAILKVPLGKVPLLKVVANVRELIELSLQRLKDREGVPLYIQGAVREEDTAP